MSQIDPSVMRRLRKILALTTSSEPGEAAAALHQAKKLMDTHGLSSQDVEISDIEESEVKLTGATVPGWEAPLLSVITKSLEVDVMIRALAPRRGLRRKNAAVVFVGHGANAAIAQYAFVRLRALLKKGLEERVAKALEGTAHAGRRVTVVGGAREAYAQGWCQAVEEKVSALGGPEPNRALAEYVAKRSAGAPAAEIKKSARLKNASLANAFGSAGFADGSSVEIHKAVHATQEQALLA